MRDIIKDYGKSETEKRERGVLDEYAEMCRYQNERQRKSNEDFSDEDLTVDEQENIDSGKEQNLKRENTQNEQIKDMINEGIDVLFLQPVDRNKVRPALELCKKKHIPVFVIDSEVSDTEAVVSTIVSDNYDAGVQCAKDMMKKKTSANIIIVNQKALNSINERVKGFRDTIKGHPQYKIVEEKESAAEFEIAMKVMEKIIYEKKNYDVVMGGNDPIALGCIAAMQMTDKTDQVMVYGVDGSPDGKAMIKAGFLEGTAAQSPIKIGEKAVQTAYSYLAGETVKKHVTIPVELITADNLKFYDMTGWQ